MTTTQTIETKPATPTLETTLAQEASELDNLHKGLVRHMTAWRSAHDQTSTRLTELLARMDAFLERCESR